MALKIFGRVQGVGFRLVAKREAEALGLSGWVRNNPDGTVEARIEGEEGDLKHFLAWCYNGSRMTRVDKIEADWGQPADNFNGFSIS